MQEILDVLKELPRRACPAFPKYRLQTREVCLGKLQKFHMGGGNPIKKQSMITTDTNDIPKALAEIEELVAADAQLIRLTVPNLRAVKSLEKIKTALEQRNIDTPLCADVHFTPKVAIACAAVVEKVRINPGNFADKKRFETLKLGAESYKLALERIEQRFLPLIDVLKKYGGALRIGVNHGSVSDRIMTKYGDTPLGMVHSALEFLDIAEKHSFHNIVISMKASNPLVMVHAYRLLVAFLQRRKIFYPLHLGVTEAGQGEDGAVKSAVGIATLLAEGIGDTIRVSLTDDSRHEIPVCKDIIDSMALPCHPNLRLAACKGFNKAEDGASEIFNDLKHPSKKMEADDDDGESWFSNFFTEQERASYHAMGFAYNFYTRPTRQLSIFGSSTTPKLLLRLGLGLAKQEPRFRRAYIQKIVEKTDATDVHVADAFCCSADILEEHKKLADFISSENITLIEDLSGGQATLLAGKLAGKTGSMLFFSSLAEYLAAKESHAKIFSLKKGSNTGLTGIALKAEELLADFKNSAGWVAGSGQRGESKLLKKLPANTVVVLQLGNSSLALVQQLQYYQAAIFSLLLQKLGNSNFPILLRIRLKEIVRESEGKNIGKRQLATVLSSLLGPLFLDGLINGIWLESEGLESRTYEHVSSIIFSVFQASRRRIVKPDYISCPSCGRTLFDLQEVTKKIKLRTEHLKGVKIAVMGCIVNGPGEMADADFGYVGSAIGKITLYKGKNVVKTNVPSADAVDALVALIKDEGQWLERTKNKSEKKVALKATN